VIYVIINGDFQGFDMNVPVEWYMSRAKYWGYVIMLSYILTILFRYVTVSHYIKKYKAPIKLSLTHLRGIMPIIIIVIFLEAIAYPLLTNRTYIPQALTEYSYHTELGVGFYGYLLELIYYVLEGLLLAMVLYMGSLINPWGGLLILLVLWVPIYTPWKWYRCNELNVGGHYSILEFTRRRAGNELLYPLLVWMVIVLI